MKRVAGVPIVALGLLLAIIAWGGSVSGLRCNDGTSGKRRGPWRVWRKE